MKRLIMYSIILICFIQNGSAQNTKMDMTLPQVIEIAQAQSIDAFRNKNMYLASYWQFRYYKAERLPGLSLRTSPIDFNRYNNKEYNFQTNEEEYRLREYFNSDATLSITQNITPTGGQLYLRSGLSMVKNLGGDKSNSYASTPIIIGYTQELNGYNQLKWQAKIEPLKYEKAKKNLIESNESLKQKVVSIFFSLAKAQIQKVISETNLSNADTLFKIGQGRFKVGKVTQDELLTLELSKLNAEQSLNVAKVNLKRMQSSFNSFLVLDKGTEVNCIVPDKIPGFEVNPDEALAKAIENNPTIIDQQQRTLEAEEQVAEAKSQTGLNTTLSAQYGLNQNSDNFSDVYKEQQKSQRLSVGVNIPIVDWGRRKGRYSMAQSNRDVSMASIRQDRIDFEQDVYQGVLEFNLQAGQVFNAAKADTVANLGYKITFQRFLIGKIDVVKLNIASNDRESARMQYIDALNQYWSKYYRLRGQTLFDFEKKEPLSFEYKEILEK
jgi:outer membrane protein TolC